MPSTPKPPPQPPSPPDVTTHDRDQPRGRRIGASSTGRPRLDGQPGQARPITLPAVPFDFRADD